MTQHCNRCRHNDSPSCIQPEILLAMWETGVVTWLIDSVIFSVDLAIMFTWFSSFLSILFWTYTTTEEMEVLFESLQRDPFNHVLSTLVFRAYCTFLESRSNTLPDFQRKLQATSHPFHIIIIWQQPQPIFTWTTRDKNQVWHDSWTLTLLITRVYWG